MALKSAAPFPLFPPNVSVPCRRSSTATEIRFSRWNNANAEPFLRRQRQQKEIEDDIRRHRRFQSADKIAGVSDEGDRPSFPWFPPPAYKSRGTPSSPSSPSIRGKASKYSKPENSSPSHPAFRRVARSPPRVRVPPVQPEGETGITVSERGIAYKLSDAPFEFQYSYTETPKVKPLALREPPFLPFGPTTMPRPWTGRAPLPPSKKKLPEFDSFRLPPPGKKGVKTVQAPGPYLAGAGPKYTAATREEILGEPLTSEEIKELIKGCLKSKRQLNMGRDGLTHNMLDNIHAHWKRRRVCKIKCKGVCTVDMDNVRQQLEEKTGGKIIYGRGGVIYLYRGRNYNYRTRPRYPLMLWKPMTPVYPRLVQRVPEGLTLEEATEMRKRGRLLPPICRLGKNGIYSNLVEDVKEAFEECELVRIDCKGMNKSDCRKIGAKLKDLVSCVLVSFEYEHILMWSGRGWKSSLSPSDADREASEIVTDEEAQKRHAGDFSPGKSSGTEDAVEVPEMDTAEVRPADPIQISDEFPAPDSGREDAVKFPEIDAVEVQLADPIQIFNEFPAPDADRSLGIDRNEEVDDGNGSGSVLPDHEEDGDLLLPREDARTPWLERVMLLVERAVEAGGAEVLGEESLDADAVLARSVALARRAHRWPAFRHPMKKKTVLKAREKEKGGGVVKEVVDGEKLLISGREGGDEKRRAGRRKEQVALDVVPYGSLGVDQLAKLLA